jgi:hypothetical protein
MPQEELNLLQFTSRIVTQASASPAKIVRREFGNADALCRLFHDVPHGFLRHAVSPCPPDLVDPAEHLSSINSGRGEPLIQLPFNPIWHRNCPDVACFANQVDDGPMFFALLQMIQRERDGFVFAIHTPATRQAALGRVYL